MLCDAAANERQPELLNLHLLGTQVFDHCFNKLTKMQVDLKWFHEMNWSDWEFFAEKDSTISSTPQLLQLICHGDCDSDRYSSFRQMQTPSAQEKLTQLEIALRPLKEDLVRSCITYANRMEELANYSVGIRNELLQKSLSNQEVLRRQVEKNFPSVVRVMGLAYLWLADSLDRDSLAIIQLCRSQYSPGTGRPVTARSLVCVPNSSCVVHTVAASSPRLSDSSRGCPFLSKAHKKIDVSMRFLARTLYFVVHGEQGEQWFDSSLHQPRVFNSKKNEARKLIHIHAMQHSAEDAICLTALEAADAEWQREKATAKANQRLQPTAGRDRGDAGGGDPESPDSELEGIAPDYAGLEDMPPNQLLIEQAHHGAAEAVPAAANDAAVAAAAAVVAGAEG
jgi:hypothetical protein